MKTAVIYRRFITQGQKYPTDMNDPFVSVDGGGIHSHFQDYANVVDLLQDLGVEVEVVNIDENSAPLKG
jgi:hypothetical protein